MPKTKGSSVAEKTHTSDSVLEIPENPVLEEESTGEYLSDGHPNPKVWKIWDFMQELLEKDLWQDYIGYLYRVSPKHAPTDHPAYLACIVSPLTLEMVRQVYGGKKYTLILSRRVGARQRQVYKEQFDIDAPVIWQDGEVPADGSVPGQRTSRSVGNMADPSSGGERDKMLNKLLDDVLQRRNEAEEKGQSFDAGEALQKAVELLGTAYSGSLATINANTGKGDSAVVTVLGNMLTEMMKANNSRKEDPILQTLLARALEKPPDTFAQLTGLLTLLKELGVKIGSGHAAAEGGGGSDWATVVEKLVDRAPDLLANAARLVPQRGPAPVAPRPAALPAVVPFPAMPAGTGAAGAPQASPVSAAARASDNLTPPSDIPESTAGAITPEIADKIAQDVVKASIVRMLFAGDSGDDAAHYAEMAHEPLARTLAETLKSNPAALQNDPVLKHAIPHPNVMQFSKEFVEYFEEEGIEGKLVEPAETAEEVPAS